MSIFNLHSSVLADYRDFVSEHVVGHSNAKHSTIDGRTFMVGALARVNLNWDQLMPTARIVASKAGLRRSRPRTTSLLKFSSNASGTIYPSRAVRGRRASRRSRIPAGSNRRSFWARTAPR